jgi:hypothetical protein
MALAANTSKAEAHSSAEPGQYQKTGSGLLA